MMELSGANDKNAKVPDYLEATIYTKDDAVIMVGNFEDVDTAENRAKVFLLIKSKNCIYV